MDIQFYIRKCAETKLALLGVITSNVDLKAESFKRFQFCGKNVDSGEIEFYLKQTDDQFESKYGKEHYETYTVGSVLSQPVWAGYPQNDTGSFGGFMGVYRSQEFSDETNVYRYIIFAGFDDACDLLQGNRTMSAQTKCAGITCGNGEVAIQAEFKPELHATDLFQGETVDQIMTGFNWNRNGEKYRLNCVMELSALQKLKRYTHAIAKHGKCDDDILNDWVCRYGLQGSRDDEYKEYLRFHYENQSPMFRTGERLLSAEEHDDIKSISREFFEEREIA